MSIKQIPQLNQTSFTFTGEDITPLGYISPSNYADYCTIDTENSTTVAQSPGTYNITFTVNNYPEDYFEVNGAPVEEATIAWEIEAVKPVDLLFDAPSKVVINGVSTRGAKIVVATTTESCGGGGGGDKTDQTWTLSPSSASVGSSGGFCSFSISGTAYGNVSASVSGSASVEGTDPFTVTIPQNTSSSSRSFTLSVSAVGNQNYNPRTVTASIYQEGSGGGGGGGASWSISNVSGLTYGTSRELNISPDTLDLSSISFEPNDYVECWISNDDYHAYVRLTDDWPTNSTTVTAATNASGYQTSTSFTVSWTAVTVVPVPTFISSNAPEYNGNIQYVRGSTYWENWNADYFSYRGYSGTDAGTYIITFTCNSGYTFPNGNIQVSVNWYINKANWNFSSITLTGYSSNVGQLQFDSNLHPAWNEISCSVTSGTSYISLFNSPPQVQRNNNISETGVSHYSTITATTTNPNFNSGTCYVTTLVWNTAAQTWGINPTSVVISPMGSTYLNITSGNFNNSDNSCTFNSEYITATFQSSNSRYSVNVTSFNISDTIIATVTSGDVLNFSTYTCYIGKSEQTTLYIGSVISQPTWKQNVEWKNGEYNVSNEQYWNNWSSHAYITENGTGTNIGHYNAKFRCYSGYFYDNNGSKEIVVQWNIIARTWSITNTPLSLTGFNDNSLTLSFSNIISGTADPYWRVGGSTVGTYIYADENNPTMIKRLNSASYTPTAQTETITVYIGDDHYSPTYRNYVVTTAIWRTPTLTISPTASINTTTGETKTITITQSPGSYNTNLQYTVTKSTGAPFNISKNGGTITLNITGVSASAASVDIVIDAQNDTQTFQHYDQLTETINIYSKTLVSSPTWKTDNIPQWTGQEINVASSNYWNNWDTSHYSYGTNALKGTIPNTYTVHFNSANTVYWLDQIGLTLVTRTWNIANRIVDDPTWDDHTIEVKTYEYNWGVGIYPPNQLWDHTYSGISSSSELGPKQNYGSYYIRFELASSTYCEWKSGGSNNKILRWMITTKYLTAPTAQSNTLTYNGTSQSPTWNAPVDSHIEQTGISETHASNNYQATLKIPDLYYNNGNVKWSAPWSNSQTITLTWAIGKKSWSVNNIELKAKNTTTVGYGSILNGVFSNDYQGFTFTVGNSNLLYNDSEHEIIGRIDSEQYNGNRTTTVTVTPGNDYTAGNQVSAFTLGIWKTVTVNWSYDPNPVEVVATQNRTVTINNFVSAVEYFIDSGPDTQYCTTNWDCQSSTITLSGVSAGSTTINIYSSARDDTTNYIAYTRCPSSGTKTLTINVVGQPSTWSVNPTSLTLTYPTTTAEVQINNAPIGLQIYLRDDSGYAHMGTPLWRKVDIDTSSATYGTSFQFTVYNEAGIYARHEETVTVTLNKGQFDLSAMNSTYTIQVNSSRTVQMPQISEGTYSLTQTGGNNYARGELTATEEVRYYGLAGGSGDNPGIATFLFKATPTTAYTKYYAVTSKTVTINVTKLSQSWTLNDIRVGRNKYFPFTISNIYGTVTSNTANTRIANINQRATPGVNNSYTFNVGGVYNANIGDQTTYWVNSTGDNYYLPCNRSANITIIATDKIVYIYGNFNGELKWHKAIPYIYGNFNNVTKWHKAEAWIYNNGSWHNTVSI